MKNFLHDVFKTGDIVEKIMAGILGTIVLVMVITLLIAFISLLFYHALAFFTILTLIIAVPIVGHLVMKWFL